MKNKDLLGIILRYLTIILVSFNGLYLFYTLFTPITLALLNPIIEIFFNSSLYGNTFLVNNYEIQIINACIAGSAYYLLFVLNMALPNKDKIKRTKMILFSFASFLILNVIRISLLTLILINSNYYLFEITHKLSWYTINILMIVLIWFAEVMVFKLKEIPFYSDLKFAYENSSLKKGKKSKGSKKNN